MNEKVIINNQKEQGYTAKAAMKLVVEHMKAKTAQAISVITLEDNQDAECILFVKMFLKDSRTDVSFISSRLISGTLSLILKKPKIVKPAERMSIKYAKPV